MHNQIKQSTFSCFKATINQRNGFGIEPLQVISEHPSVPLTHIIPNHNTYVLPSRSSGRSGLTKRVPTSFFPPVLPITNEFHLWSISGTISRSQRSHNTRNVIRTGGHFSRTTRRIRQDASSCRLSRRHLWRWVNIDRQTTVNNACDRYTLQVNIRFANPITLVDRNKICLCTD